MNTEKMDIVYTLKVKPNHDEIRYSLRSLKNLPHKNVWLVGDCPEWINHDTVNCFELSQAKGNKWANTANLLKIIAENDNISEDFIWFNDDFFVLKKINELNYFCDRTLSVRVTDFYKLGWAKMNTGYTRRLQVASRALKWQKKPTLNFELHLPIIFNRAKLSKVIEMFPSVGSKRSLYGNCFVENPIQRSDCKIYDLVSKPDKTWDFVSTSDEAFLVGEVGGYIRRKFRGRCEYESN